MRIVRVTRTLYYEGPEDRIMKVLNAESAAVPAKGTKDFGDLKITSAITGIPQVVGEVEVKTKSPERAALRGEKGG